MADCKELKKNDTSNRGGDLSAVQNKPERTASCDLQSLSLSVTKAVWKRKEFLFITTVCWPHLASSLTFSSFVCLLILFFTLISALASLSLIEAFYHLHNKAWRGQAVVWLNFWWEEMLTAVSLSAATVNAESPDRCGPNQEIKLKSWIPAPVAPLTFIFNGVTSGIVGFQRLLGGGTKLEISAPALKSHQEGFMETDRKLLDGGGQFYFFPTKVLFNYLKCLLLALTKLSHFSRHFLVRWPPPWWNQGSPVSWDWSKSVSVNVSIATALFFFSLGFCFFAYKSLNVIWEKVVGGEAEYSCPRMVRFGLA